jgi:hypothetical protein
MREITVGTLATAKHDTGLSYLEEAGVCVATKQVCFVDAQSEPGQAGRLKEPGYTFIFERGGYDGFTSEQVERFLEISDNVSKEVADYRFENKGKLEADYQAGRFAAAFEERRIEVAQERSAWPSAREVLRREDDANLKREIAGLERKRDVDLDR